MSRQRRIVYIKKDFQLRFILRFCAIVALGSLISAAALYYFSSDTITSTFHNSRLAMQTTSQVILPALLITMLINVVIAGAAVAFISLYNSHKIAGPLFRFEKELNILAEGDYTHRLNLREGDQLIDLATSLNKFIENTTTHICEVRGGVAQARDALPPGPESQAAREALDAVEDVLLKRFTLARDDTGQACAKTPQDAAAKEGA